MELTMSPKTFCRIQAMYSEEHFQERKKLAMVKARTHLKASKGVSNAGLLLQVHRVLQATCN